MTEANLLKNKVFLCYLREDVELAKSLYCILQDNGFEVWFDLENLDVSGRIVHQLSKAIADTDIVVHIDNLSSDRSHWVNIELSVAFNHRPPKAVVTIPNTLSASEAIEWIIRKF